MRENGPGPSRWSVRDGRWNNAGDHKRVRLIALMRRGMRVVESGRAARAALENKLLERVGRTVLADARLRETLVEWPSHGEGCGGHWV